MSVVIFGIGIFATMLTPVSAHRHTVFFKSDRLIRSYQWQPALEILENEYPRYEGKREVTNSSILYQNQLKTCLLALRKATDRNFSYDMISFPFVLPEDIGNRAESYVIQPYYVYSGNYSESLHINYDWCTAERINPAVLSQLITASLILNDTLPASKFLFLLNQTLFRNKDVAKYSLQNPEFARIAERGKGLIPRKNYRVLAYFPDENAVTTYLHNKENPLYYEYFLVLALGAKDLPTIASDWNKIKAFYPRHVPRHLQEALLATYNYVPARYIYPQNIEGIESETWNDYWAFILDDQAYQNEQLSFEEMQRKWKHTFWFYHLYMIRKFL